MLLLFLRLFKVITFKRPRNYFYWRTTFIDSQYVLREGGYTSDAFEYFIQVVLNAMDGSLTSLRKMPFPKSKHTEISEKTAKINHFILISFVHCFYIGLPDRVKIYLLMPTT